MDKDQLDHMRWLVRQRSKNQECCLKLYCLLEANQTAWRNDKYFWAAQAMVGAAFSLWRAVFLGDKKEATKKAVLEHSMNFLESVIADNAVSYVTDKKNNEWTFNYYVESARSRLEYLHGKWPAVASEWVVMNRKPKPRWEYAQELLEIAVENFDGHFRKRMPKISN